MAKSGIKQPMRCHFITRNPFPNVNRLDECVSTDPIFANCKSIDPGFGGSHGFRGAGIYYGTQSHYINGYGIKNKSDMINTYKDFIREEGAPSSLRRDRA